MGSIFPAVPKPVWLLPAPGKNPSIGTGPWEHCT